MKTSWYGVDNRSVSIISSSGFTSMLSGRVAVRTTLRHNQSDWKDECNECGTLVTDRR
jgi:hypothetical protein